MEIYRKEYRKEYYIKNIEKFRNYYDDNKENILEYEKLYYQQNRTEIRDKQRAYFHEYYQLNKEKIQENSYRRYYDGHNLPHKRDYLDMQDKQGSILKQNIIISLNDD